MLTTLLLGPWLLAQGLYVRRMTVKLPEAAGDRQATAGHGPALRVLILGDSAAAGVGVAHQDQALAGQLGACLAKRFEVNWTLLAATGLDTQQVISLVDASADLTFDVVLVSVGVNDVTQRIDPSTWIALQQQLIDRLKQKFGAPFVILSQVPALHRFPALPQPLRWYLGRRADAFNRALAALVQRNEGCQLLTTDFPFSPEAMAADGFHPGPAIYTRWAHEAARCILRHFAPDQPAPDSITEDPSTPAG